MITLLKNKEAKSGTPTTTVEFVKKIKTGEWKKAILELRASENLTRRKKLKGKLPAVTLCGIVDAVKGNDGKEVRTLTQPSGYIGIDVDYKGKDLTTKLEEVKKDRHTVAAWRSSGGKGFWILFKINPEYHDESFRGITEYLSEKYSLTVDPKCGDKPRLCFVSYDPEVKFNHTAKMFLKFVKEKKEKIPKVKPTGSLSELQHITQYVVKAKKDIAPDYNNWFNTGVIYAECGENGRQLYYDVSKFHNDSDPEITPEKQFNRCLKFVADSKNKKQIQKITIKSLYGYLKKAKINCPVYKAISDTPTVVTAAEMKVIGPQLYRWKLWEFAVLKSGFRCRGVSPDGIGEYMRQKGYCVWAGGGKREYYQVVDNIVRRVTSDEIGDSVVLETKNLPKNILFCFDNENDNAGIEEVKNETQRNAKKIVEGIFPKFFKVIDRNLFLQDTPTETYFKFTNCVVRITKTIQLLPYTKIKKLIWADTIKPYNFSVDETPSILEEVLNKIFGAENKEAYMSCVGYMINGYIHEGIGSKILFCCDLNTLNDGGNGKDFIYQLLNEVRHVTVIHARDIDFRNRFKFQEVSRETEILWLQDLNEYITMERLYNVTSTVTVEKKGEAAFKTRIKVGVSLQHAIDIEGTSDSRRQIFLLLTNYFGQLKDGIKTEYKELLGEYYDSTLRLHAHNFLARCCQLYHKKGIIQMSIEPLIEARKEKLNGEIYNELKLDHRYKRDEMLDAVGRENLRGMTPNQFIRDLAKWSRNCKFELRSEPVNSVRYYTIVSKPSTVYMRLHRGGKPIKG